MSATKPEAAGLTLEEALAAHLWADRKNQTCGCGWEADSRWMVDTSQPNRVEQWLAHVAAQIREHQTRWYRAVLLGDEVVEAAAVAHYGNALRVTLNMEPSDFQQDRYDDMRTALTAALDRVEALSTEEATSGQ